ncbi:class IV adenylate cyclase [Candidatus Woesearchaeota archaeon]|nr:class IV adenylate cyclase [Candidatus Woesearchaeota archaeon]
MAHPDKYGLRARIESLEEVKQKLLDIGTLFCGSTTQVDHYFKPIGQEQSIQKPGAFIIRVRDEVDKKSINLKKLRAHGDWIEHYVEIKNASEMNSMLREMNFTEIFTIFKDRIMAQLDDFEINIDNIKGLGTFLEIELKTDNPEEAKNKALEIFRKIGVHDKEIEQRGYTRIIAESKGYIFEGLE